MTPKTINILRFLAAFLLAPPIGVFAVTLLCTFDIHGAVIFTLVGAVIYYFFMFLILPVWVWFEASGWNTISHYIGTGIVAGGLVGNYFLWRGELFGFLLAVLYGAVIALLAYIIMHYKPKRDAQ